MTSHGTFTGPSYLTHYSYLRRLSLRSLRDLREKAAQSQSRQSELHSLQKGGKTHVPSIKPSRNGLQNRSEDSIRSISKSAVATPVASPVTTFVVDPPKPKENKNLPGFNSVTMLSEVRRSARSADKKAKTKKTSSIA
ncbi:MAG: hypothetical protein DHS80DRAFT_32543 [Piptocephalis tieghemiana]|nr:MAG: hypothetical protein DHS80DRAFT_32543 [Piptocephalis tieghemiana]